MTTCALCRGHLHDLHRGRVLGRHDVTYRRCARCGSVVLPEPHWLDEAYSRAISALDVGLVERCLQLANVSAAVITAERLTRGTFLDFAGGYGLLTRLMRDRGLSFQHHDPMCENVFASGFVGSLEARYDLVTAFEVFEHLADPVAELAPVARTTDLLLLTTELLPSPVPAPGEWDYYAPQTGQHITFATLQGLGAVAESLGYSLTSSGRLVHLFHRRPLTAATRLLLRDARLAYGIGAVMGEWSRRRGLTRADSAAAARRLGTAEG